MNNDIVTHEQFPKSLEITYSELDLSRRGRCGHSHFTPVDTLMLGHEIILVPAAPTVIELSTVLLIGIVVPSLSVVVALSQESGQEADILLCVHKFRNCISAILSLTKKFENFLN